MFNNVSMTGSGVIVYIIAFALSYFGVLNVDNSQIARAVEAASQVIGFLMIVWGQIRRNDLQYGLWRVQ